MDKTWDAAVYLMPVILFLPTAFVLVRFSTSKDTGTGSTPCPKSAAFLMLGVLLTLFLGWLYRGYTLFFGQ